MFQNLNLYRIYNDDGTFVEFIAFVMKREEIKLFLNIWHLIIVTIHTPAAK